MNLLVKCDFVKSFKDVVLISFSQLHHRNDNVLLVNSFSIIIPICEINR